MSPREWYETIVSKLIRSGEELDCRWREAEQAVGRHALARFRERGVGGHLANAIERYNEAVDEANVFLDGARNDELGQEVRRKAVGFLDLEACALGRISVESDDDDVEGTIEVVGFPRMPPPELRTGLAILQEPLPDDARQFIEAFSFLAPLE